MDRGKIVIVVLLIIVLIGGLIQMYVKEDLVIICDGFSSTEFILDCDSVILKTDEEYLRFDKNQCRVK